MKNIKIIIIAFAVAFLADSCASHCGNKSWRTKRYVYVPSSGQALPFSASNVIC